MTTVYDTLSSVAGSPQARISVSATLQASNDWLADRSARIITGTSTLTRDDGSWQLDLTPTGDYEDTGAVYAITEGSTAVYLITVPADAGQPVRARDCLVDAPAAGPQPSGQLISDDPGNTLELKADGLYAPAASAGPALAALPYTRQGNLAVQDGTTPLPVPFAGTITDVRAAVGTAPVGGPVAIRINRNGASAVLLNIPDGEVDAVVDAGLAVTVADLLTVDITAVGSTTPGANLTIVISLQAG